MANQQQITTLNASLDKALSYFAKNLISRAEWGAIKFDDAELDLKRAKSILDYLKILPLEFLPDAAITQITQTADQLSPTLEAIDKYTILNNAQANRDALVTQLHQKVDSFYTNASPWIPFLAYQKGDVAENLAKLSTAVEDSRNLIVDAKSGIEIKRKEIDEIITAARSASASAGAAVFTQDFDKESTELSNGAGKWLVAAMVGLGITILTAIGFWIYAHNMGELSTSQIVQESIAKVIILSMLITASAWCGRNYKAHKHLATVNRHRALSLRTLKAFSVAASDDQTKNAVLLEATRAVFSAGNSGYLEGGGGSDDNPMKIIEIAKSIVPKG